MTPPPARRIFALSPRWTPRLRTVLLVVNLTVMLLPLGSLAFLQLYEDENIRQKEAALYAQGAYVVALFHRELADSFRGGAPWPHPGLPSDYGLPIAPQWRSPANPLLPYSPVVPSLQPRETAIR